MKISDDCMVYRLEWADELGVEYAMETDSLEAFTKIRDYVGRMKYTEKRTSYIEQCTVKAPSAE